MFGWIKQLRDRWMNWCGDRDLEIAIRRHLTADGYYGGSAKLMNVRLAAVQRPGWLQVYRFDAVVKSASGPSPSQLSNSPAQDVAQEPSDLDDDLTPNHLSERVYGLVREDARRDETTVRTFTSMDARRELFALWSADLIQLRGGQGIL